MRTRILSGKVAIPLVVLIVLVAVIPRWSDVERLPPSAPGRPDQDPDTESSQIGREGFSAQTLLEEASAARTLVVQGVVIPDTGESLEDAHVLLYGARMPRRLLHRQAVLLNGSFRFLWDTGQSRGSASGFQVQAEGWRAGTRLLSQTEYLSPGEMSRSLVLFLRGCGKILARAVDDSGNPVPHAEVMITQLPQLTDQTLGPARFLALDTIVRADSNGVAWQFVRTGGVEVRARRAGGSFGKAARTLAVPGRVVDAGDVRVGSKCIEFRLRVVDEYGAPIVGASVHLNDRTVRFGKEGAGDEVSHFKTDGHGSLLLRGIPIDILPLDIAIASPEYFCRGVRLDRNRQAPHEIEVALKSRPSFEIRVVTESGNVLEAGIQWSIERLSGVPERVTRSASQETKAENVLATMFGDPVVLDRGMGRYQGIVDGFGRFRVSGLVAGGTVLHAQVEIEPGRRTPVVHFFVPDGRKVIVSLGPDVEEDGVQFPISRVRATWFDSRDTMVRSLESIVAFGQSGVSEPMWVPSTYDSVRLEGERGIYAPWKAVVCEVPFGRNARVNARFSTEGTSVCCIRVVKGGEQLRLKGQVILMSGSAREKPARGGMFVTRTDASGSSRLRLLPGRYSAMLLKAGRPSKWESFTLETGREVELRLALD